MIRSLLIAPLLLLLAATTPAQDYPNPLPQIKADLISQQIAVLKIDTERQLSAIIASQGTQKTALEAMQKDIDDLKASMQEVKDLLNGKRTTPYSPTAPTPTTYNYSDYGSDSGSCANGSCGSGNGRRGLFGRRR